MADENKKSPTFLQVELPVDAQADIAMILMMDEIVSTLQSRYGLTNADLAIAAAWFNAKYGQKGGA